MENNVKNKNMNPFQFKEVSKKEYLFEGYEKSSRYLTMRDGVKIAITLVLPKKLAPEDKISIILTQTRYWRDFILRVPFRWFIKELKEEKMMHKLGISNGFGFVYVDVRGSGASFGTQPYPFFKEGVEDGRDIIDWIISQLWSNGNVVAIGSSYRGTTAELVATLNHPAVKGIVPMHSHWDFYTEVVFPGGVYNHYMIGIWGLLAEALDKNSSKNFREPLPLYYLFLKGVKPVDSDINGLLLKEAIEQHSSNVHVYDIKDHITYRDDPFIGQEVDSSDTASIFTKYGPSEK